MARSGRTLIALSCITLSLPLLIFASPIYVTAQTTGKPFDEATENYARQLLKDGKQIFRFDTFGSEDFWGGALKLHQAIQGQKLGGVGPGISPKQALELGLKVDMEAVPKPVASRLSGHRMSAIAPRRCARYGTPTRSIRAASTMMAASRRWRMSSTITTTTSA